MNLFPASLHTATVTEGHAPARQLAKSALAERSASHHDVATHLSAGPDPSVEILTALYFHTVTAANGAWRR